MQSPVVRKTSAASRRLPEMQSSPKQKPEAALAPPEVKPIDYKTSAASRRLPEMQSGLSQKLEASRQSPKVQMDTHTPHEPSTSEYKAPHALHPRAVQAEACRQPLPDDDVPMEDSEIVNPVPILPLVVIPQGSSIDTPTVPEAIPASQSNQPVPLFSLPMTTAHPPLLRKPGTSCQGCTPRSIRAAGRSNH
jgi:hypothetical protein